MKIISLAGAPKIKINIGSIEAIIIDPKEAFRVVFTTKIKTLKPKAEKSERIEKEKQQPLFEAPVTGELPHLDLLDTEVKEQYPQGVS